MSSRTPGVAVPFVLAACTAVSVLSTDLVTPSIPDLPEALGTNISNAQMVVSINLLAYALAQLVHGPVADAVGRKRLLVGAFGCFALFSVFCALAVNIEWLLAGRFLQGLASSVPSVVIVLIVRELYAPHGALKVMALYGATLGIAPAVGPLVGGYLHIWFGWEAGFWFIAIVALLVMAAFMSLVPESLKVPRPLNLRAALRAYGGLLGNGPFIFATLGCSFLFSAYYAYVTSASVVFIELLGMPTERYGLSHVLVIAAYIVGSLATSRCASVPPAILLRAASLGMTLAVVLMAVPVVLGTTRILLLLAPMTLYGFCLAFVLSAGPLVVLGTVRGGPQGPAAALLGSLQLGLSAVMGYASAQFYNETAVPLVLVMLFAVLVGTALSIYSVNRGSPGSAPAG